MTARLLLAVALSTGCYEHHQRVLPADPHPCAIAPIEIAEVDPLDFTGNVRVVSRGADYAVSWSSVSVGGAAIFTHDGRTIRPYERSAEIVALDDGYLLTHRYTDTFWRVSAEGEPVGEPLTLPNIVAPHWQSFERHGERMHFATHPQFGPGENRIFELDLTAWSSRPSAFTMTSPSMWSFTADRALYARASPLVAPDGHAQAQRLRPDGTSEIVFETPLGAWYPRDTRFDATTESWLVAGHGGEPDYRVTFARISAGGEITQLATLSPDAEIAPLIATSAGAYVSIAPSPIGPALALRASAALVDAFSGVTVVYPSATDTVFTSDVVLGIPSAWTPSIVWSEADAGFAVVTVERDEPSGRTYLALRCGLRPD